MKKSLVTVIILLIIATGANAQVLATANSPEYKNVLKMSAALFTRNTFQMGFERFINPNTSFLISAGLTFKESDFEKVMGVRTEAQMKFHVFTAIQPKISHRLYFAPYLLNEYYENGSNEYDNNGNYTWVNDTFDAFGGGMLFGWSFSFANRINLDIYTGGGFRKTFSYNSEDHHYDNGVLDYGYSGIVPRLGVDIGFWF